MTTPAAWVEALRKQALDRPGDLQQARDLRVLLRLLAQARLVGEGLVDRDRLDALHRDQLGEPVDLAVGHLQHAADVADRGLGEERAEGDDLGDAVAAVALLDVGDHLLAAVHAEVDVEVGHRDAVGVEEPLEEQAVAQRVEVGDGQRVGDEAAGAGAAAGADRDRAALGPLDEVGDDQEVAGEAHVLDDAELEVEPLAVGLGGRGVRDRREAGVEAGAGLAAQLLDLVVGEARQDRLALLRAEGAAAGDLDGARHRLGQVGEERDHLVLGLEAVLGGQPAARLLLVDVGAVGDAEQRVVGGVQRAGGEVHVVGGDQRQVEVVGEADEAGLGRLLDGRARGAVDRVALDLDVEAAGEDARRGARPAPGRAAAWPSAIRAPSGPSAPPVRQIRPLGVGFEGGEGDVRLGGAAGEVVERGEPHQVAEAGLVLGEQDDRAAAPAAGRPGARASRRRARAGSRRSAGSAVGLGGGLGELERARRGCRCRSAPPPACRRRRRGRGAS